MKRWAKYLSVAGLLGFCIQVWTYLAIMFAGGALYAEYISISLGSLANALVQVYAAHWTMGEKKFFAAKIIAGLNIVMVGMCLSLFWFIPIEDGLPIDPTKLIVELQLTFVFTIIGCLLGFRMLATAPNIEDASEKI